MKKYAFLLLLLITILPVFGQKRKVPVKRAAQTAATTQPTATVLTEISQQDWDALTAALNTENWTQAAALSSLALGRLKNENDKKQLAQLRYLYVYALAGKASEGKTPYAELEKTARGMIGREFVMPSRTILADCDKKVNYICANNAQILRVTAADKVATIHSFEYVKLTEKFDVPGNAGKNASLNGILESAEMFTGKSNIRIIRLIFAGGIVSIASN